MAESAYQRLHARLRDAALLRSAGDVLGWDQETYMPAQGVGWRADQLALISGQVHRLTTSPEVGDWLAAAEAETRLAAGDSPASDLVIDTNLRGWRRTYDRATQLPVDLVEEWTRTTSLAQNVWTEARRTSDFAMFRPHLEKVVGLARRRADAWGWETCRYDALIDEYEPGARTADLVTLFADLGPQLAALVGPASERSARFSRGLLNGHYPAASQQAFNRAVAEAIGFDFAAGRIDTTTHPFCTGLGPGDTRLTTRYDETDFSSSLYGVLHEAGHGMYDQGLNREEWGHPAGQACSLGIHESQSRLWENHVGGSRTFWDHWLPLAARHFPHLGKLDPEQIVGAVTQVQPSLIRVEADEVTYDLHIILRFEIERALIEGDLAVADVPGAWNEMFHSLLGLKVPDDARGCLQDIHWSLGLFGYFATYSLGNVNAAQLMHHARNGVAGLDDALASGDYAPLLSWLRARIHTHGQRFDGPDLMRQATGEAVHSRYFLDHLRAKFL